jgi:ketosteroid isomerase-like protein
MVLELALVLVLQQGLASSDVVKDPERIEHDLASTWKKGDCAAWGAMLAPEWSVVHITGAVITKAEALEMCKGPRPPIDVLTVDELSVRAYGDAAVVTGRTTMKTGGTEPASVMLRFTDVCVRRAGRWQVVASHATRLGS